jgi:CBS domain-containing protein
MDITTTVSLILEAKGPDLWSIEPEATVFDAIALMAEKNIGALPVMENGHLLGMLSERDYTRKIILLGRASRNTPVAEIMSSAVVTASPQDSVEECLQIMTQKRIRHLPVIEDEQLVGIVSIGDLVNWIISLQSNAIEDLERMVTGGYPG